MVDGMFGDSKTGFRCPNAIVTSLEDGLWMSLSLVVMFCDVFVKRVDGIGHAKCNRLR